MSWGSAVHLAPPPETIFQMFMVQRGRWYSGQCFRASGEPLVVDILMAHTQKAFPFSAVALAGGLAWGRGKSRAPRVECRSGSSMWGREAGPQVGPGSCKCPSFFSHEGTSEAFSIEPEFPQFLTSEAWINSVLTNWPAPKWWTEFHKAFQIPGNLCPLPPSYADCKITLLCEVICPLWIPAPTFPWFSA